MRVKFKSWLPASLPKDADCWALAPYSTAPKSSVDTSLHVTLQRPASARHEVALPVQPLAAVATGCKPD